MKIILLCLFLVLSGCQTKESKEMTLLNQTFNEITTQFDGSCEYYSDWYAMYISQCDFTKYQRPS